MWGAFNLSDIAVNAPILGIPVLREGIDKFRPPDRPAYQPARGQPQWGLPIDLRRAHHIGQPLLRRPEILRRLNAVTSQD